MSGVGPGRGGHKPSIHVAAVQELDTKSTPRKSTAFVPQFVDSNTSCGREYRCIALDSPLYQSFQSQADFSNVKQTVDQVLVPMNNPTMRLPKTASQGPQLFEVRFTKTSQESNACDDTGEIDMVHLLTRRVCRGYYNTGIIRDSPGVSKKRGIIIFQDFIITDRYASQ